jgi:hypothetical protein
MIEIVTSGAARMKMSPLVQNSRENYPEILHQPISSELLISRLYTM